jgi:hypothetical protein
MLTKCLEDAIASLSEEAEGSLADRLRAVCPFYAFWVVSSVSLSLP